ncbi:TIGR03016 family PEP-CTERM system-associated outer membrane protein [Sneathiella limimaris]|uniref:TIGR03016 family PEP-CTERM system-associated outer membrane protein n=1 Tax=Sneathiella limimaris TaxID=1964213 RepID=UPI00146E137E|nr:TIGR03016 family PEP-CTERM system-associated outer membrane protein [Sneathiella limimaris]
MPFEYTWTYQLKKRKRSILSFAASALACSCLVAPAAIAEEIWEFTPYVGVSEQFTDNVFSSTSDEKSDFITSIDLGFNTSRTSNRSDFDFSYSVSQDYYAKYHELDGYRQNVVGNGTLEILDDHLFLDGRVTFTEETLGATGPTTATDRTQSDDRTQVLNASISPYYIYNYQDWVITTAKYGYTETRFFKPNVGESSTDPSNQKTNEFQLNLASGVRFDTFRWSVNNRYQFSESDVGDEFEHGSVTVNGEIPINRMFSILGTIGYDAFDINSISDEDDLEGVFGGAGVRFHPNSRTDASFQVGHRFDDVVYDMNVEYRPTSQDSFTATYTVSVNSADNSLASTDILDEQGDLIRPNFNSTRYIDDVTKSKTFQFAWNGSRGKSAYRLAGNFIEREILATDGSEAILGVNGRFSRQLTKRARLNLNARVSDIIDGETVASEETSYNFGTSYSYEFGNGLTGTASYDLLSKDNDTTGDIVENAFTISIRKTF